MFVEVDETVCVVWQEPLADIGLDDVPYDIQNLATALRALLKDVEELVGVGSAVLAHAFEGDSSHIDGVDLHRTDRERGSADGIDEPGEFLLLFLSVIDVFGGGDQTTAIGDGVYRVAVHKIAVVPLGIVVGTPSCHLFIHKFAILVEEIVRQHGKCHHIFGARIRHYIHEYLLMLYQVFDVVDSVVSIGEFAGSEDFGKVFAVEDGYVSERGLNYAKIRLIQGVDELLKCLAAIGFRVFGEISVLHIVHPEAIGVEQEGWKSACARSPVGSPRDKLLNMVDKGRKMVCGACLERRNEEKSLCCQVL